MRRTEDQQHGGVEKIVKPKPAKFKKLMDIEFKQWPTSRKHHLEPSLAHQFDRNTPARRP